MLSFDHLVIASKHPGKDQINFTYDNSLKGVEGGDHSLWGTYNELCYFMNDNYIEWLGLKDPKTAENSDNPLIQQFKQTFDQGEFGPFQFALRTSDMDEYINHFNLHNIPYYGPFPGERKRPDGTMLKWRMLFPVSANEPDILLPFLIEWSGKNLPSSFQEINTPRFQKLILRVKDIKTTEKLYETIYKLKPTKDRTAYSLENGQLVLEAGPSSLKAHYTTFSI
ncbi:VOC family protein [Halobacillus sp. Marseille-P3879]|uniref:VOC family protein n=1 Tax=Halobacillus sp. Marseille-P3879 TaxID=2045014 RepID=UPI000C79FA93|nr:VOC family protein [Halobacillus sp. Marseille-P3879]